MPSNFVLVTGGTGFIGRHLVRRLLRQGQRVRVTGREEPERGSELLSRDFQDLPYTALAGCECVWHLAAETDTRAADETQWRVNCEDAAEFLRMCRESGVPKLVYASSCAVYGRGPVPYLEDAPTEPLNAYGAAKLALDKLVSKWAVGIRPANVYGPGEEHKGRSASFVAQMVTKHRRRETIELFQCARDLIAVDDVADLFAWAERFPAGVYNASTGVAADYLAAAVEISRLTNELTRIERKPCPFPFEFQEYTAASTRKTAAACSDLGLAWKPREWRAGLGEYIRAGWPEISALYSSLSSKHVPTDHGQTTSVAQEEKTENQRHKT